MGSTITPYAPNAARIMITDGGPHPADFWAQVTAEHIAPVPDSVVGTRRIAALALQAKISQALIPHHHRVQTGERAKCVGDAAHHLTAVEPETHAGTDADLAIADIEAAAKGTEWEIHFTSGHSRPDWLDAHLKDIDAMGGDAKPLTTEQQTQYNKWLRQKTIRDEIVRHFATAQHIERSWHADRLAGRA